jgi:hypothetical protein
MNEARFYGTIGPGFVKGLVEGQSPDDVERYADEICRRLGLTREPHTAWSRDGIYTLVLRSKAAQSKRAG